jgi:TPR repeat protein
MLSNNLTIDQVCGNCGAWESETFGKGWIVNCLFDQTLYAFNKRCEINRWIPKYDSKSIRWCRKYAEQGKSQAQYNLGLMYKKGESVSHDVKLAHMWFSLATCNGHADAVKQI